MLKLGHMTNLIDMAAGILSQSERQVEIAGQNISNVTTPGYKRRISFSNLVSEPIRNIPPNTQPSIITDISAGKLINTARPLDMAISGPGFFAVSANGQVLYTRSGQFNRDADGRLVTPQGQTLQVQGGGDLVLKDGDFKVLEDGSVTQDGEPLAKLAVVDISDPATAVTAEGGALSVAGNHVTPVANPSVYQGKLEASNVSMGPEMISIMSALRRAETGQRLVSVYDDLMGRVLSIFGQAS